MVGETKKASPNASSVRPLSERDKWIITHVLIPLESNFRQNLDQRRIDFWCDELKGWDNEQLLATVEFIKRECQFFPTISDFYRLRPKKNVETDLPPLPPGTGGKTVAQLAAAMAVRLRDGLAEKKGRR